MRKLTTFLFLTAFLCVQVSAQKAKITKGVLAVQNGKIGDAIENLEMGLSQPELIKKQKDIAKGHFYLHQAYFAVATDSTINDSKELKTKHPDAIFKAAKNLEMAMNNEESKAIVLLAINDKSEQKVWGALFNEGVSKFNNDQGSDALKYFETANKIVPDNFLTYRMLGSSQLAASDTAGCISSLEKCMEIFNKSYVEGQTPETMAEIKETDEYKTNHSQLSYVVQQLAYIYEGQGETRKSLDLLTKGLELLPDDEAIKRQELIVYQKHPDMLEEAEKKFDEALERNPDDNNIRLAYATLLERAEKVEKAYQLYSDAYDRNPEDIQANYGKAAYFINKAAAISTAKVEYTSDEQVEEADGKIKDLLGKAYPFVLKLHELQPGEAEWLSQLVQITPIIGKNDEMATYAKKLSEILQNQ